MGLTGGEIDIPLVGNDSHQHAANLRIRPAKTEIPDTMAERKKVQRRPLWIEDLISFFPGLLNPDHKSIKDPRNEQKIDLQICLSVYMVNCSWECMMADDSGRFQQGIWIPGENRGSEVKQPEKMKNEPGNLIEERIAGVSKNLSRNIDDIFQLTRDLLTTEAGHRHIEQLIDHAGSMLERRVSELVGQFADLETDKHGSSDKTPEQTGENNA